MCEFLSAVWDSCKEHGSDIVCSIIETTGVIVAARIGVGGLKKIAKIGLIHTLRAFLRKS